jgi:hypothetical protein
MDQAHLTQAWLAAGDDTKADVTGQYFYHLKRMEPNLQSHDVALQDRLIVICTEISECRCRREPAHSGPTPRTEAPPPTRWSNNEQNCCNA